MRINRLLVIGLLSYWVIGLAGCAKRDIKNIDSKGRNIICFGDSITFGYGVNPGEDYPSMLAKKLNVPVINAGIDGDTSIEALRRLEADVLSRDPLLVIVEFGGNDFLRNVPLETTVRIMREIVDSAQKKGAMVAIADISAGMFMRDYRVALREVAKEKGAIFIPSILSGIITNPSMKSDFLHPNVPGYKLVAENILRSIKPYLNREIISKN